MSKNRMEAFSDGVIAIIINIACFTRSRTWTAAFCGRTSIFCSGCR